MRFDNLQGHWSFLPGCAVGIGLIAAGLMVQLTVGPVRWERTAWPVNVVILAVFIALLVAMHLLRRKIRCFAWLSTYQSAVCSMIFALAVTLWLGFTEQRPSGYRTSWLDDLLSSWPFVAMYFWLTLSLGMTILKVAFRKWSWRTGAFLLNHLGLFIVLVAATLGNADIRRLTMTVGNEEWGYGPQDMAVDASGASHRSVLLDFAITLKHFEISYHEPDSLSSPVPDSYTSFVRIYTKESDGLKLWADTTIKVNKPISINGWKIYQYGYDEASEEGVGYSVLGLVHDPWLPWVYAGIFMMLGGAFTLFFTPNPTAVRI